MLYRVTVVVPIPEEKQLDVWWSVARYGYNFTYNNGCAKLYGERKTQEDVDFLKEQLQRYSGYDLRVEENDSWKG